MKRFFLKVSLQRTKPESKPSKATHFDVHLSVNYDVLNPELNLRGCTDTYLPDCTYWSAKNSHIFAFRSLSKIQIQNDVLGDALWKPNRSKSI